MIDMGNGLNTAFLGYVTKYAGMIFISKLIPVRCAKIS